VTYGTPAIKVLLKGMGGAALGVWVAHGEGRALFPHAAHLDEALAKGLAPLRYVDDNLAPTEVRALLYTTPSRAFLTPPSITVVPTACLRPRPFFPPPSVRRCTR